MVDLQRIHEIVQFWYVTSSFHNPVNWHALDTIKSRTTYIFTQISLLNIKFYSEIMFNGLWIVKGKFETLLYETSKTLQSFCFQ